MSENNNFDNSFDNEKIIINEKEEFKDTDDYSTNPKKLNTTIVEYAKVEEEKNRKKKKLLKSTSKIVTASLCFGFLGIGIGAGKVIGENYINNYEKSNFKFNKIDAEPVSANGISLTSNNISSIFEEVGDSVVNISTTSVGRNIFNQPLQSSGSGSGIIYKIQKDLVYIVTNNHVIENAGNIVISVTGKEQIPAKLVGSDQSSDLAVLSVNKKTMEDAGIKNLTLAKFSDSEKVKVGEFVFPIGNALGRGKTITQGIISAQNKEINIDGIKLTVLQTDAAINPGNSGGALINSSGEVVGINTAKLSSSAIEGIGYAIPSNIALKVVEDIIENGSVQKPYFGIIGKTITEEDKMIYNLKKGGVFVTEVEEGSNADKSGLIASDIITEFNGKPINSLDDLSNAIKNTKQNETIAFKIIRYGYKEMDLNVTLAPSTTSL